MDVVVVALRVVGHTYCGVGHSESWLARALWVVACDREPWIATAWVLWLTEGAGHGAVVNRMFFPMVGLWGIDSGCLSTVGHELWLSWYCGECKMVVMATGSCGMLSWH